MEPVNDADFLHHVLSDGEWHGHTEILARSIRERGHGLTIHSRASTLRERGHTVETRLERNDHGRTLSFYRLVALNGPAVEVPPAGPLSVPADGAEQDSPVPLLRDESVGTLPLFVCVVDESAGLRGAYSDEAA